MPLMPIGMGGTKKSDCAHTSVCESIFSRLYLVNELNGGISVTLISKST